MKKRLLFSVFCFLAACAVYAQTASPLPQLDTAVKNLAVSIGARLGAERVPEIAVASFVYRDSIPSLASYWTNQLTAELSNIPGKTFTVLTGNPAGTGWVISGEITDAGGIIRVYTRLVRQTDRSIAASYQSDFERSQYLVEMLLDGGDGSSGIARDAYESDSWEFPVSVEIGSGENTSAVNRSLHYGDDEDFFLIVPAANGRIVMETTGSTDTMMEFFDAGSGERFAENDDGGSSSNARIRHTVEAGKRYIAKVLGYSNGTGRYGFRAYIYSGAAGVPDEHEPDNDSASAKLLSVGTPQRHSFDDGDDVDWVKFNVERTGRYTIRARGTVSTRLDTHIQLYDADLNSIEEDDDGGEDYDSRLSLRLERGLYYLKARCLDDDPEELYTISVQAD